MTNSELLAALSSYITEHITYQYEAFKEPVACVTVKNLLKFIKEHSDNSPINE